MKLLLLLVIGWSPAVSFARATDPDTPFDISIGQDDVSRLLPCECPSDTSSPVCGTDSETYDNFCKLRCASRTVIGLGGKCRGKCPCPTPSEITNMICELIDNCPAQIPRGQICGTDNTTYKDSCNFICAQLTFDNITDLGVQCGGACPCPKAESPCSRCPEEYMPICGNNDITYGNYCMFACARLANPDLVPSCRNECPCQLSVETDSRSSGHRFPDHLKQAFLVHLT